MLVGVITGGAVAGIRATNGDSQRAPAPTATAAPGSPRATAEAFAAAWSAGDTAALYALLDIGSQGANAQQIFAETYDGFAAETTLSRLTATVTAVTEGSATLSVHLATAYFGDFEYTTTLALTHVPGKWLVAWDATAIHPDMAGGSRFRGTIDRPHRGTIFDRNGTILAVTRDVRLLGLNRSLVIDRDALTAAVASLGLTKEQVDAAFASTTVLNQRVTVGPVPDERAESALTVMRTVPGILLYFETQRVHPLGPAAAHVVGYTRELTAEELEKRQGQGFRIGDRVGAIGLEASFETQLAGQAGAELRLVDVNGLTLKTLFSRTYIAGKDLTTTLDAAVLSATYARLGARAGAAVVIDPRTNAILALNSSPSFDPDAFERNDRASLTAITANPGKPLTNRATTGLYSAGSTFKLITGAAGLASGLYKTTDQIFCGATWAGLDPPRRNWEGTQGPLTIAEGLMRSCNSVFYEIALNLYNKTEGQLSKMARSFGFGSPTGVVGLSDEAGLVPDAEWKKSTKKEVWFPGDEVNLGIGQGDLLITPLQLANAYSSFTAGQLRAPVLVAGELATPRGAIRLTPEQFALLRFGLRLVTSPTGTAAFWFSNSGYTDFAGKSGTAEDVGTQSHVLFVAYSPAAAPRALAAVVLDEGRSGSLEAGPIARDIVVAALK
jgi:penicillin-binding protein 2